MKNIIPVRLVIAILLALPLTIAVLPTQFPDEIGGCWINAQFEEWTQKLDRAMESLGLKNKMSLDFGVVQFGGYFADDCPDEDLHTGPAIAIAKREANKLKPPAHPEYNFEFGNAVIAGLLFVVAAFGGAIFLRRNEAVATA